MKLYKTTNGLLLNRDGLNFLLEADWDVVVNHENLFSSLSKTIEGLKPISEVEARALLDYLLPPIGRQEVWAAGVTYLRSRDARREESLASGGADLYDKVYEAERPELFFKSLPHRVAGHKQAVHIRRDSAWNVPEPELTLFINATGSIHGYTVGNDMSSRSIEGENALYLPQAKIYEKSAALGPCLYVPEVPLTLETKIEMEIKRVDKTIFKDAVAISRMKRSFGELAGYLFRETDFLYGCYLMTGTCLVPPPDFTLFENDQVDIRIEPIGTLSNKVVYKPVHVE